MKNEIAVKRILQGAAFCYGGLGLWLGCLSFQRFVQIITGQCFGLSFCVLVSLSALSFAVAVQNIKSPGVVAVRNLVAVTLAALSFGVLFLLMKIPTISCSSWWPTVLICLVLLLVIPAHYLLSRTLVRQAGYEELKYPLSSLYMRIARQKISAAAQKRLRDVVWYRDSPPVPGYFLVMVGWFLLTTWIFFIMLNLYLQAKEAAPLSRNVFTFESGLFWAAILAHAMGRAILKKIALSQAVCEMLIASSDDD